MKILVFTEYWDTRGGGERYLLNTMEALMAAGHDVTACVPCGFDWNGLLEFFNINTPRMKSIVALSRQSAEHYSSRYDLTVVTTNCRYFNYRSPLAIFILQSPHGKTWGWNHRRWMEARSRNILFRKLRKEYVVVYSRFVADSMWDLYGVRSEVVEPMAGEMFPGTKGKIILSVGRIFRGLENHKNYEVLIDTFKEFSSLRPQWEYVIVGGCRDYNYLSKLKERARGFPVRLFTNATHKQLAEHYGEATLFWHGAGYGVNLRKYPEKGEHFGISTVEAMSAECLALVFDGGGGREIVDACGGIKWATPKELCARSHAMASLFPNYIVTAEKASGYATKYFKQAFQLKWLNYMERIKGSR